MNYLPPASEGWGKVIVSVCLSVHRVGGVPQSVMRYPPSRGGVPPVQRWGTPVSRGGAPLPPRNRTADGVLDTRRVVCLLRSRHSIKIPYCKLEFTVYSARAICTTSSAHNCITKETENPTRENTSRICCCFNVIYMYTLSVKLL